jgi:uncharacterized protein YggU (UPF0235/DUF167 family)
MRILVHTKLHKHADAVIEIDKGIYEVHTSQPAVDNRANEDIIRQIAGYFGIAKSSVRIFSGASAKTKVLEIKP